MERSASSSVLLIDVNFQLVKVEKSVGHVSLCRHMEHIQSIEVLSVFVCSILDESKACIHVPSKRCQVEWRELITLGSRIDPFCNLLISCFLYYFCKSYHFFNLAWHTFDHSMVE